MKRLTALAKKSVLSITMLTVLVLGLGVALPTVARANLDAGGAPYVTDVYCIYIGGGVTAVYIYYSNGDHTMYYAH